MPTSDRRSIKSLVVAEQALDKLIEGYKAGLKPTTYGELARHCGYDARRNGRWFGQVAQLIDIACARADVPSFALARVLTTNRKVNEAAWRGEYTHLRDEIIKTALGGKWTDEDFTKIRQGLAFFSANGFGHKKAWDFVKGQA